MSTDDSTRPDSTLLETAMATGNDEGAPGERQDGGPLTADERRLLDRLRTPDATPSTPAVESAAVASDEPPLPAVDAGDQGDGLAPEFTDR